MSYIPVTAPVQIPLTPGSGPQTVTLNCLLGQAFQITGNASGSDLTIALSNDVNYQSIEVLLNQGAVASTIAAWPGVTSWPGLPGAPVLPPAGESIKVLLQRTGVGTYSGTVVSYSAPTVRSYVVPSSGAQTVTLLCQGCNSHLISCHASGNALTLALAGYTVGQPLYIKLAQGAVASTVALWFNSAETASTISSVASDNSLNDSANGFITAGFLPGDRIYATGAITVGSATAPATISSLTASKMILTGVTLTNIAAGSPVTINSRRCMFIGTTNSVTPLTLPTANKTLDIGLMVTGIPAYIFTVSSCGMEG
jgi:hypothetical protein